MNNYYIYMCYINKLDYSVNVTQFTLKTHKIFVWTLLPGPKMPTFGSMYPKRMLSQRWWTWSWIWKGHWFGSGVLEGHRVPLGGGASGEGSGGRAGLAIWRTRHHPSGLLGMLAGKINCEVHPPPRSLGHGATKGPKVQGRNLIPV